MSLLINPFRFSSLPYTPPLDAIGEGSAAAFSMRKVRAAYSGQAFRIQRSSDSTEMDVGFGSDGYVDMTAAISFVGANNGYVRTWYDQSGNTKNLTNTTNLPAIIISGTLQTRSSLAMPNLTGVTALSLSTAITGGNFSLCGVVYATSSTSSIRAVVGGSSGGPFTIRLGDGSARKWQLLRANVAVVITASNSAPSGGLTQVFASGGSSGTQTLGCDGTYTTSVGGQTYGNITVFGRDGAAGPNHFDDCVPEMLMFWSVISSGDRDTLVANQKAYYATP